MKSEHGNVNPERPEDLGDLKVKEIKNTAAGIPAITHAMSYSFKDAGIIRSTKLLLDLNQKGGIDCPSCAWADPDGERTFAEFCENGAKSVGDEATTKHLTPDFFAKYSVAELSEKTDLWINEQGRLTQPMILEKDATHYKSIGWEDAFKVLSEELNALASPDEAVFYTSGRTSNEAAFLYQLFVRQFGTNNLPDCSNMCHESTSVALAQSIGLGKASIRLEDLEDTDLIIIIGQNPGTNAPRMLSSLQKAKENGAKIIAVNPLPEAGLMNFVNPNPQHYKSILQYPIAMLTHHATKLADLFLQVRIGGDSALLKGLMKILLEKEKKSPTPFFDYDFINSKTEGYQEFIAALEEVSWQDILEQSGISEAQINEAAEMFASANRVITCWAMGITQHKKSVETIQDIVNLHLLRGQLGRQGAGLCPVRGHSNVQGDRTMGIWEKMLPSFRAGLEKEFHFKTPEKDGFNTVEALKAMHEGRAKVFFAMGGNFALSAPDTEYTARALRQCNLTAQVVTKLNRTALLAGKRALILPCLGRTEIDRTGGREQFVTTESTMLNVQMSKGILEPASEHLRSETWIVGKMAQAVLKSRVTFDWEKLINDYDNIRDAIARVVEGCENYNENVKRAGGFYMPNKPRDCVFPTDTGKAKFTASRLGKITLKEGEMLMATIRSHDQFNTTVYRLDDRYRGIYGSRRVILMNEKDIAERGLKEGEIVDITSHFEGETRRADEFIVVPYEIPKDCCATYYPETNVLVPVKSFADKSHCPTSKSIFVTVAPHLENSEKIFAGKFH